MIHICYFSGDAGELTARQTKDPLIVLRALSNNSNVSTWNMGAKGLWKTIAALKTNGWIDEEKVAYPWHRFLVTDTGREKLAERD